MRSLLLPLISILLALSGSELLAAEDAAKSGEEVQLILKMKCISCHGPEKQEGNLRLDSLSAAAEGGDRGQAIIPGDVEKSLLIKAISFEDPDFQMPPKQKLSEKEIEMLTRWVQAGAAWPEPVAVLFEDDPKFLTLLSSGNGTGRILSKDVFAGQTALGMTPLQRDGVKIPGWNFAIREKPLPGEFRYLRLAWKKWGAGSVMIELAANGSWPDAKVSKGRYVAGPNTTGWAAISIAEQAPSEWTVVTLDLWKDMGNFTLTGIAPTCDKGEEAFFDSLILGPTIRSLDAYRPGVSTGSSSGSGEPIGDAFTDKRNPIRKLFRGERLDLWSLKKPQVQSTSSETLSIDHFIRARLAKEKLKPSPEADRRTLIRRVTFDLTGLPPSADEVDAFVADKAPDAYQKLVARLLDSPAYGERQTRFWLDLVRYADTNGYERDEFRPLAWEYRDYVIRSFNQDKPFDQFIREQLAGDELVHGVPNSSAEADKLIATGYLRLGPWDSTASVFQEEDRLRSEVLADLTNTTSSAFLGLTMSCCQCHDHKYDPLSQADHYRLRAFFAGVTARDDLSVSVSTELDEIEKHNAELEKQADAIKSERTKVDEANEERRKALTAELAELKAKKRQPRLAMGATDAGSTVPATHVFYQGDFLSPREEVSPGFVSLFTPEPALIEPPRENTTGRRLALANWIASVDNPWTARVLVNRVWQQHFGTGIVATPNDFGYSGGKPTHPELLDWLAVEFVQSGWSIKELHRRMVTSDTYRQASRETSANRASDPENRFLWRQNIRRLDAETLRDSLLMVSGMLKPHDAGKPLWPPVSVELREAQPAILEAMQHKDAGRMQGWFTDPIEQTDVRSVFLVRKRCLPIPFLQAFDLPDSIVSCARRDTTVVAPQALMLLNSPESIRYAQGLAARVGKTSEPLDFDDLAKTENLLVTLFRVALNRTPSSQELKLSIEFLKRHTLTHRKTNDQGELFALTDLCRAILNLNEFAYID